MTICCFTAGKEVRKKGVSGASGLQQAEGQALRIFRGDCMFVPASSVQLKLHGKAQFLRVTC